MIVGPPVFLFWFHSARPTPRNPFVPRAAKPPGVLDEINAVTGVFPGFAAIKYNKGFLGRPETVVSCPRFLGLAAISPKKANPCKLILDNFSPLLGVEVRPANKVEA